MSDKKIYISFMQFYAFKNLGKRLKRPKPTLYNVYIPVYPVMYSLLVDVLDNPRRSYQASHHP